MLRRDVPLALIGSEDRGEGLSHPVICEQPTAEYPPPAEEHLWREATDEEYAAYVKYWDDWYDEYDRLSNTPA